MSDDPAAMTKNTALITARRQQGLSQQALARRIQEAGHRLGHPNGCNRANVHRWEDGAQPSPHYVYLLESVLGQPAASLGFAYETHDMDRDEMLAKAGLDVHAPIPEGQYKYGPMTGIWLSEYVYHSDSRDSDYTGRHYVQVLQRGAHLNVRSLPKQHSRVSMDLSVNGRMATGTWTEHTSEAGYYQGSVYDGGIQLEINQAGTRMKGKWIGFGRDPGEINTGPWQLSKVSDRVDNETRTEFDHDTGSIEAEGWTPPEA